MPRSLSSTVADLERPHTSRRKKNSSEFLQHVNVIDFLEALEVANVVQATADEVKFSCPFPGHTHGDQDASAYMNDGTKNAGLTTVWKCHGCQRKGNAITFLTELMSISRTVATREIKQRYAAGFIKPTDGIGAEFARRQKKRREEIKQRDEIPALSWEMYHDKFGVDWTIANDPKYANEPEVHYMPSRGFSLGDLEEWGIGWDGHSERLCIPVCDPDGNLIGVKGRAWEAGVKPKYKILGDKPGQRHRYGFQPYEKSLVVFGIDKWGEQQTYVFVEGEIDVMSLWRMEIPALCTGGATMSEEQAKLIRHYANEIVLFLDDDNAGSNGVWGYNTKDGEHHLGIVELLEPFMKVKIVGSHKYDANDYLVRGKFDRVRKLISKAEPSYILH